MPKLSIIVVSYNTRELTLECLRSVARETMIDHELIVVDNASQDGSAEAIAREFPGVRLMAEKENHGFAKANNLASQVARGEYLLLLNPDTVVLDKAIDRIVEFAESRRDARIWGGRTLYGDRSLNPTCCWRRMSVYGLLCQALGLSSLFRRSALFNPEAYGGWMRDSEREVDIVSGCFLLIDRQFWQQLGGFDLRFVMYGEEADLCLRARRHGARPRMTPAAQIVHYGGASEKVRSDKTIRLLKAKISLVDRHFPPLSRPIGRWLLRMWPASRALAASLSGRAGSAWKEIWSRRAEWWNGWSGAEASRPR